MLRSLIHSLTRRPLLSGGIVVTLGLAFAATLIVLGLLDAYLLRPLPYANAKRLVAINEYPLASGPTSLWRMTFGNAADIHDGTTAFSRTAIVRNEAFTVRTPGGSEVAFIQRVTPEFFSLFGQRAQLGEVITSANAEIEGLRGLVLSHEFWQRRFGGDRAVLGTTVTLDGRTCRVLGVLPPATVFPLIGEGQQAWLAMLPSDFLRTERAIRRHFMFGELAPGRSVASAQAELKALALRLGRDFPATNADKGIVAVNLRDALVGSFRRQLLLLQAAVALVLVVACVNAGGLLLAQAIRRRREFAVRLALGAGTRTLFRQFLLESLGLTGTAALLGLLLATWLAPLTTSLLPDGSGLHQLQVPTATPLVIALAGVLAIAAAAAFSLVPLWQARRLNIEATLRDGSRQLGSAAGGAATRLLVSLQIAVALALLISAGLLVRSLHAVEQTDRGMPVDDLYTFRLGTRGERYAAPAARIRYFEGVVEKLRELPQIAAGGAADFVLPSVPASSFGFVQEGDGLQLSETPKRAVRRAVSSGLIDTLQLRVRAGRWLTESDRADTPRVAVISQSLADKYWPGQDPLGRRVRIEGTGEDWWEVVGVVSDLVSHGPQPTVIDSFFLPHTQATPTDTGIVIRTRGGAPLTKDQIDRAVAAVDPENTAYAYLSVGRYFAGSAWQTRFSLTLVGVFAALAVGLCLVGVYAVLASAVAGRTSEFGVRLALGATRSDIGRLVLRDGLRMTLPGLAVGLGLAALAAGGLRHLLFGIGPLDLAAYAGAATLLASASTVACLLPASRAMRVDPLRVLRAE